MSVFPIISGSPFLRSYFTSVGVGKIHMGGMEGWKGCLMGCGNELVVDSFRTSEWSSRCHCFMSCLEYLVYILRAGRSCRIFLASSGLKLK